MPIFDHPEPVAKGDQKNLPFSLLILGVALACLRFYVFHLIDANRSHDALWQFAYLPLWVIDFPITIIYFVTLIPFGEAFIGPVWWFTLPFLFRKWLQYRKNRTKVSP
jgi:hypothetical protein